MVSALQPCNALVYEYLDGLQFDGIVDALDLHQQAVWPLALTDLRQIIKECVMLAIHYTVGGRAHAAITVPAAAIHGLISPVRPSIGRSVVSSRGHSRGNA